MVQQHYNRYTAQDQLVWKVLFDRQTALLHKRACSAFWQGLAAVGFHRNAIPDFAEVSGRLQKATGWQLEPVEGMLNDAEFFGLLAQRKFPATVWIRSMEQFDFIEEPDLFHGVFGHAPLLMDQGFADYLQFLGQVAVQHLDDAAALARLERLYGFTVQFGLVQERGEARMYGAGLLSSSGEIHQCSGDEARRLPFDLATALQTPYSELQLQEQYFVLSSWDQLTESVAELSALLASGWQLEPVGQASE
ncbi:phenylalanine 4-monooxygenase [Hymenobacter psychrotolerans]|uniref:Phenylalanine 4-hydroxylase n=1 Tax=Hymenobacter psychrotolerans DSM 18569 TaxID=1121959 RepID=A0A1M6VAW3_9BACT|nr:phenylalanine 4-monooxygenase [Hymenobacter psychrotolerans]SHK78620.1 Phenylalanine 4-hydroxylase [Hymenobacter psychrotolerans DSM 18569]